MSPDYAQEYHTLGTVSMSPLSDAVVSKVIGRPMPTFTIDASCRVVSKLSFNLSVYPCPCSRRNRCLAEKSDIVLCSIDLIDIKRHADYPQAI